MRKLKNTILKFSAAVSFSGIFLFGALLDSVGTIHRASVIGFIICLAWTIIFVAVNSDYLDQIL